MENETRMIGAVRMLVPTKVETTLTVNQLYNGLFTALFGTPSDIQQSTGVDMSELYVAQFIDDEGNVSLKVCYMKDEEEKVYDERGAIWRNMLKIGNDIFPNADMDITVHKSQQLMNVGKEEVECSTEENTSLEKAED